MTRRNGTTQFVALQSRAGELFQLRYNAGQACSNGGIRECGIALNSPLGQ